MPKTKAHTVPDVHLLTALMEEYQQTLREAERGVKKVLSLNPQKEEFWDALTDVAPQISMIEGRSDSIWEEIVSLIDQLPED